MSDGSIILRKESSFELVKMNGTKLNEYSSKSQITHIFTGEMVSGIMFVCIATLDGVINVLSVPVLDIITEVSIGKQISAMSYVKETSTFIVSDSNGETSTFRFC